MDRGKFIVIYGANNTGKSEQAKRLTANLNNIGIPATYLKYPIYDLAPTGPRLNSILREKKENPTPLELQKIFAQNRRDFEPELRELLDSGLWVVAEDYRKTGIAWGLTYDVDIKVLEEINSDLYPEDLEICFDGERFTGGIERSHIFEQGGRWEKNRIVHALLACRYSWEVIDSSESMDEVEKKVFYVVEKKLLK